MINVCPHNERTMTYEMAQSAQVPHHLPPPHHLTSPHLTGGHVVVGGGDAPLLPDYLAGYLGLQQYVTHGCPRGCLMSHLKCRYWLRCHAGSSSSSSCWCR